MEHKEQQKRHISFEIFDAALATAMKATNCPKGVAKDATYPAMVSTWPLESKRELASHLASSLRSQGFVVDPGTVTESYGFDYLQFKRVGNELEYHPTRTQGVVSLWMGVKLQAEA